MSASFGLNHFRTNCVQLQNTQHFAERVREYWNPKPIPQNVPSFRKSPNKYSHSVVPYDFPSLCDSIMVCSTLTYCTSSGDKQCVLTVHGSVASGLLTCSHLVFLFAQKPRPYLTQPHPPHQDQKRPPLQ